MKNCPTSNCIFTKFFKKIFCCKTAPIVASLNLFGVIGKDSKFSSGLNFETIAPLLKRAFEVKKVKAVALNINSPGGSPVQSELIYNYIRELSLEKKIPVFTFAQDLAASGGYWLLLSGDEIYAHHSSIVGSIGVIFSGFGFVDLIKRIGIDRRIYTEGKNKAILDPFLPEESENIEILKDAQRDVFESFAGLVKSRRGSKLKECEEKIFTGAFWSGKKSLELGLVDGIADLRGKMREKFGEKVEIIQITAKKKLLKSLFSERSKNSSINLEILTSRLFSSIEERIEFNKFGI